MSSDKSLVLQDIDYWPKFLWTILGFMGAGISIGIRLSRGEVVNKWAVLTALAAGGLAGGTVTDFLVQWLHLSIEAAFSVAWIVGLVAMGFVSDAFDGKISFINKLMGRKK